MHIYVQLYVCIEVHFIFSFISFKVKGSCFVIAEKGESIYCSKLIFQLYMFYLWLTYIFSMLYAHYRTHNNAITRAISFVTILNVPCTFSAAPNDAKKTKSTFLKCESLKNHQSSNKCMFLYIGHLFSAYKNAAIMFGCYN